MQRPHGVVSGRGKQASLVGVMSIGLTLQLQARDYNVRTDCLGIAFCQCVTLVWVAQEALVNWHASLPLLPVGTCPALALSAPGFQARQTIKDCIARTAVKLEDPLTDPSLIADAVSLACKRDWMAATPGAKSLVAKALARFKVDSALNEHEIALATVLQARASESRAH